MKHKLIEFSSDELIANEFLYYQDQLKSLGYCHYEISSYGKFLDEQSNYKTSKHNQMYWKSNQDFMAVGMGAASLVDGWRITRPRSLKKYYQYVDGELDLLTYNSDFNNLSESLKTIFIGRFRIIQEFRLDEIDM